MTVTHAAPLMSMQLVPGVWEVSKGQSKDTTIVKAETALLAAAKVAPVGSVLELSPSSIGCGEKDTRFVMVTEPDDGFDGHALFGSEPLRTICVAPLLAL